MAKQRRPERPAATEWFQVAKDQLSNMTWEISGGDRTAKNQRSADARSDDRRPRSPSRLPKASTRQNILAVVGVITLVAVAGFLYGISTKEKERPTVITVPLVVSPTNEPTLAFVTRIITATPYPTWTPHPRPPTSTPPTTTKVRPTPTPDLTSHYVELFASCNGRYIGETKENRREAARSTLTRGFRTLSDIIDIVEEKCQ